MRIERLDLVRYGKFTDHAIEFGAPDGAQPDFHIVYGPNEAGKSTVFNAWLDLLFGIETKSKYNFLHSYDTMRIGARLNMSDGPLTLARIKKRTAALLDEADRPVPEGLLQAALGGVDRDAYRTMFSLDDETLDKGGAAILESEGDLGQLLFSASSGLAALSQELSALRKKADDLHRPGGRSATRLRELKKQLDDLTGQRKQLDIAASAYGRLVKDRDRATADYDTAMAEKAALTRRLDEINGLLAALPRLAELVRVRDALVPLQTLREAPRDWVTDLPTLRREETQLEERARRETHDIEALRRRIEALEIDETALANAARIDDLSEFAARHQAAAAALPEERAKFDQAAARVGRILNKLDRAGERDPANLVLPAATVAHLRDLIDTRATILRDVATARDEVDAARERERAAEAEAQDAGAHASDGEALALLKTQLAALQGETARLAAEHRQAERTIANLRDRLDEDFEQLLPWRGDVDALARLRIPDPATLRDWEKTGTDLRETMSFHKEQVETLTRKRDRLTARRDALERTAGLVDEAVAARMRSARESAWNAHVARLDGESAETFRTALEQDDALTAARLAQSVDRAEYKTTSIDIAEVEADLEGARKALERSRDEATTLKGEIASGLRACDPALADLDLTTLRNWLSRREAALDLRSQLRQAEADRQNASDALADARQRLRKAIAEAGGTLGADMPLADLLELGQTLVDAEARMKDSRRKLEHSREETRRRRQTLQAAEKAEEQWRADWEEACAQCWFADPQVPAPESVRALLDELNALSPALEARDDQARRIEAAETVASTFRQATLAIADDLALPIDADPRDLYRDMRARADEARKAHDAREQLRTALDEARENARTTREAVEQLARRKAQMTAHFDVETLDEVEKTINALRERETLRERAADLEAEILAKLGLADMTQAEARLEAADRDALEREKTETAQRIADAETRTQKLYFERETAADAVSAVGGDDAVARLEEQRRTVLLEIEDTAKAWIRLKAGILAAEQALRGYRDNHRSSMMERASAAFRKISCGAYLDLVTQSNGDKEELVGIDHAQASKRAGEMSKGTCFQLYLALRIAGYYEFAASRTSLPFIADDILETFDDDRARETLRLLAEMGEKGQVIYLTHHPHLCNIAREVCPGATLHELPGPLAG